MEHKHTPGPWHYGEDSAGRLEVSTENKVIAKINVAFMDGDAEANARLIAAAPDLLAVSQAALSACERLTGSSVLPGAVDFHALAAGLRNTIAKATGEST